MFLHFRRQNEGNTGPLHVRCKERLARTGATANDVKRPLAPPTRVTRRHAVVVLNEH